MKNTGIRTRNAWRITLLVCVFILSGLAQTANAALSASPNPSTTGSYTVTWSPACSAPDEWHLSEDFNLSGNFVQVYSGCGTSFAASGKQNGTYYYLLEYCFYLDLGEFGYEWVCIPNENPYAVTVNLASPPPTPATITVPTGTNTTGSYTVSWSSSSGATSYQLEEQKNSGSWIVKYTGSGLSKAFSGQGNGTYAYRVKASNASGSSGYKTSSTFTVLLPPPTPATITTPTGTNTTGNYTVSWSSSTGATSYQLQEQFNGGAWTTQYTGSGLSKAFTGKSNGTYSYRVKATNSSGSSGYKTSTAFSVLVPSDPVPETPPAPIIPALPSPDSSSDSVGTMAGSFRVDESGNATYSIPLVLARGSGGVTPQLALQYSSQQGNGPLGIGWSVSGLSAVTRCRQTIETEGATQSVQLATTDRYCLDGQKLIAVSGAYGANGTEYRTEIDSYAKITSYGQAGNGPQRFVVRRKDGTTWDYGNTVDSRNLANGPDTTTVVSWLVNRIKDTSTNGNPIDFTYDEFGLGEVLVTQIDYSQGNFKVVFNYSSRSDSATGYIAGSTYQTTQLLDSIETYGLTAQVRTYNLSYQNPTMHGQSEITEIEECDGAGTVCYPATTFDWSNNSPWFQTQWTDPFVSNYHASKPGDITGDGRADLVYHSGEYLKVRVSSGSGLVTRSDQLYVGPGYSDMSWHLIDYNGDGLMDLLYQQGTSWYVKIATSTNLMTVSPILTGISANDPQVIDANGDGLPDLVYGAGTQTEGARVRYMRRATGGLPYEFGPEQVLTITGLAVPGDPGVYGSFFVVSQSLPIDLNGDGNVDYLGKVLQRCTDFENGCGSLPQYTKWVLFTSTATSLTVFEVLHVDTNDPYESNDFRVVDVNGDGYTDLMERSQDDVTWTLYLSDGKQLNYASSIVLPTAHVAERITFTDINRDGRLDLAYYRGDISPKTVYFIPYVDSTKGFTGSPISINYGFQGITQENQLMLFDINGDGFDDIVDLDLGSSPRMDIRLATTAYQADKKVTTITNGLGAETEITYDSLLKPSAGIYTRDTDANTLNWGSPVFDLNSSVYVVHQVSSSAPTAASPSAMATVNYSYKGAKAQAGGRGFLGFREITSIDAQTGIRTVTTYKQQFPFTGMPLSTVVYKSGALKLSEATNSITEYTAAACGAGSTRRPYVYQSDETARDLADQSVMKTVTTTTTPDACGNVLTLNVLTQNGTNTYSSGATYQTKTTNTYYNTAYLPLSDGRLQQTVVEHWRGSSHETRKSTFAYSNTTGLLTQETIEPDYSSLKLTTTYTHDTYGNRTTITESATGYGNRVVTLHYDADGQYVDYKTDTYGRNYDSVTSRDDLGQPEHIVDINSANPVDIVYGSLGRKYFERDQTGRATKTTYSDCTSYCVDAPTGAAFMVETESAGAPLARAYFDVLGRQVRSAMEGFDGTFAFVDTEYDSLGRVSRKSEPYFSGDPSYWTTFTYDLIGRVTQILHPDNSTTTTDYDGSVDLRTVVTNALGQSTTEDKNGIGDTERVIDELGGQLLYTYNLQGHLYQVTAPGGVTTTMLYDLRGRKYDMADPDKGHWTYTYTPWDELKTQTDAKGQVSTMAYDNLGRMTSRVDTVGGATKGNAAWIYDACTKGLGHLYQEDIKLDGSDTSAIVRAFSYDGKARPAGVTTTITGKGTFTEATTYDEHGRVFQQFDATASGAFPAGQQLEYNAYGYLSRTIEAQNSAYEDHEYHQIVEMDARGNVTEELIGGMTSERSFEADTGRIQSIYTYYGLLQDLTFQFDELGNLTERGDYTGSHSYTESFIYDDLNRLTYTSSSAATNLTMTYDAAGNLKSKTNMQGGATYNYGSASVRPHAVTSVSGVSYGYDANGNMTSGDGRTLTWTTFDKPSSVTKGGHTTAFKYGPNRARFQRTDTTGGQTTTTLYIGNVERIEQPGGVVLTKRYLGPVIVTTASNNPTPVELLVLTDHLGSIYALVNRSGYSLAQGMSFDAWGLRRDTDWSDFTSTELTTFFGGNTRRGYTGHEEMDETGLIHMNGRAYDPKLGRFTSADPFVQVATNTQSYNRYSYVFNNPLSYTDPTGFSAWTDFRDNVLKPVVAIYVSYLTWGQVNTWAVQSLGWGTVASGAIAGSAAGFVGGAIQSGSIQGAAQGAFSGAIFGAIGGANLPRGEAVLAHGVAGGTISVLQGGKFGHGFVSAGLTKAVMSEFTYNNVDLDATIGRTIVAAIVGGTTSIISGGKFANGAATAALAHLVNAEATASRVAEIRKRIAELAASFEGDTSYSLDSQKGDFGSGQWKCNLFVHDVLELAGVDAPLTPQGPWPLIANGWANKKYQIPGWIIVDDPMPGDVAAIPRSGDSGHVGIYIGDMGHFHSNVMAANRLGVGWSQSHLLNDWAALHVLANSAGDTVYRRYVGGH